MIQWQTKAGNVTTNLKLEVDFNLPEVSATNVVIWKFHVDESTNDRYDMILERDLLT